MEEGSISVVRVKGLGVWGAEKFLGEEREILAKTGGVEHSAGYLKLRYGETMGLGPDKVMV